MNHKWQNDTCIKCGLKREKREYKKPGLPYSILGRDSCWYDKVNYSFGTAYWYGKENGFERPQCSIVLPNPERSVATMLNSSNDADNIIPS